MHPLHTGELFTWTLPQEAVHALQPLPPALGAPVGGAITLPGPLHGPVGAGGGAGAPAGPLVPHAVHCGHTGGSHLESANR